MSHTVINVENLSKKYILKHQQQEKYTTLRDMLVNKVKSVGKKEFITGSCEEFWALKDINFEIKQGDRVGIIGRNGAGKSTLLKILSRITEPSTGRVSLNGRVASLLEVGTGFHPELSGRENIFLNGSILGMSKSEIKKKFDEIVEFAEIERFLDTPVKRYSSGMYVRLAFSVAAHLEPEILIIDEVLAVGDAQFQRKCMGKMNEVSNTGRTILFVSHNMQAVKNLCDRAILLNKGTLTKTGDTQELIDAYLRSDGYVDTISDLDKKIQDLPKDPVFKLDEILITQRGLQVANVIENAIPLDIEVKYTVFEKTKGLRVYFDLYDDDGTLLLRSFHDEDYDTIPTIEAGSYKSSVSIPANLLAPIKYELGINASIFNVRSCLSNYGIRIPFMVEATGKYNRAYLGDTFRGKIAFSLDWENCKLNSI